MMIRSNIRDRCAYKSNPNCFSHTENDPEILFRVVFLFHVRAFHVINHLPAATTKVLNLSRKFWSLNNWVQGVCKCFDSKLIIALRFSAFIDLLVRVQCTSWHLIVKLLTQSEMILGHLAVEECDKICTVFVVLK